MTLVHSDAVRSRLLAKVEADPNGGCWLWAGLTGADGYGSIGIGQKTLQAHRVSYEAFCGPVGSAWVLHRCDVRPCINPDHLFLGTHADNMADMVRKGRKRGQGGAKGEASPSARLTEADVRAIRASTESSRQLAARLPVTDSLVRRIRRGEAWSHLAASVSVVTCDAASAVHVSNKSGFLIWTKKGRNPHVWHGTRERAEAEASRLAAKFPGQAFFVVALTTKHKVRSVAACLAEAGQ